ncbi:hypothetical protein EON65_51310 [archaeon]|nr:MAG: hypothetical protein EON65_51310 [archaeon]
MLLLRGSDVDKVRFRVFGQEPSAPADLAARLAIRINMLLVKLSYVRQSPSFGCICCPGCGISPSYAIKVGIWLATLQGQ